MDEDIQLFSGEDSSTSDQGIYLGTGLHVVQVLDEVGSESEKDEKLVEGSSPLLKKASDDGKNNNISGEEAKQSEKLQTNGGCKYNGDSSDEGTPERDLPGRSLVLVFDVWNDIVHFSYVYVAGLAFYPKRGLVCYFGGYCTPLLWFTQY